MSRWAMTHPDGPPMGQTFGSRLDAADDARKEAKMYGPGPQAGDVCPACETRWLTVERGRLRCGCGWALIGDAS